MRKIYKALIIGSGAAAYSAADWLFRENIRDILIITENRLWGTSRNTGSDKQTYYKLSMDGFTQDSAYKMACDMFSSGCCDGEKMYLEAVNSTTCFMRLCQYEVGFPQDAYGGYPGYKTDHDNTVRATSVGPLTSKVMTQRLEERVIEKNKTPLLDKRQVVEILKIKDRAVGVRVLNTENGEEECYFAQNIICATGAPACIYEDSVYPLSQHGMTGVLIEAGVRMCNFTQWQYGMASTDFRWNVSGSFMQVIPRFISIDKKGEEREFLRDYISDIHQAYSLVFLKGYQWPFSFERSQASSQIDLAVYEEMKKGRTVYLDYRKNPEGFSFDKLCSEAKEYLTLAACLADTPIERLEKLNKKAIAVYSRQNIDLYTEALKIAVCAQHNNGGVYTDNSFQTDIKGLYVIGEAAGTFGLSRPGGSALNDTQVGGLVAAKHIKNKKDEPLSELSEISFTSHKREDFIFDSTVSYSYLKKKMSEAAGFKRDYELCRELLNEINDLIENYGFTHRSLSQYYRDKDMLFAMRELLYAIIGECPETGSRGGAIFIKEGKIIKENPFYRDYLTVTGRGKTEFIKASPVPTEQKSFEHYLNKIVEGE